MGKSADKGLSVSVRDSLSPFLPRFLTHTPTDIATISVNQARDRWNQLNGDRLHAWLCLPLPNEDRCVPPTRGALSGV